MYFAPPAAQKRQQAQYAGKTRRLWIHAGLHKTGTTSLQSFLAEKREALAERGVLYVRAGTNRYLDGNHNVAWELTGDHRFELDTGCLEEAVQEIADFPGDAILSSEDFESLLHRPKGFDPLLRHHLLRHHRVGVLVYLRNQADYLASLAAENQKHGVAFSLEDYLARIVKDGRLAVREWVFQFDAAALAAAWPYRNAGLVLRNYHAMAGNSTVIDAIGLMAPGFKVEADPRLNVSHQKARLRTEDAARLMARFADANRRLCARLKLDAAGLLEALTTRQFPP